MRRWIVRKGGSGYSGCGLYTLGDFLKLVLDALFPIPDEEVKRLPSGERLMPIYNPRVERVGWKVLEFLEGLGADRKALEELRREFRESLEFDKFNGSLLLPPEGVGARRVGGRGSWVIGRGRRVGRPRRSRRGRFVEV